MRSLGGFLSIFQQGGASAQQQVQIQKHIVSLLMSQSIKQIHNNVKQEPKKINENIKGCIKFINTYFSVLVQAQRLFKDAISANIIEEIALLSKLNDRQTYIIDKITQIIIGEVKKSNTAQSLDIIYTIIHLLMNKSIELQTINDDLMNDDVTYLGTYSIVDVGEKNKNVGEKNKILKNRKHYIKHLGKYNDEMQLTIMETLISVKNDDKNEIAQYATTFQNAKTEQRNDIITLIVSLLKLNEKDISDKIESIILAIIKDCNIEQKIILLNAIYENFKLSLEDRQNTLHKGLLKDKDRQADIIQQIFRNIYSNNQFTSKQDKYLAHALIQIILYEDIEQRCDVTLVDGQKCVNDGTSACAMLPETIINIISHSDIKNPNINNPVTRDIIKIETLFFLMTYLQNKDESALLFNEQIREYLKSYKKKDIILNELQIYTEQIELAQKILEGETSLDDVSLPFSIKYLIEQYQKTTDLNISMI